MDIRAAQPGDLDRLMEIEALTFPPAEAAPRATFAFRIAHFPEWFYVAEEGGEIVGLLNGRRMPHETLSATSFTSLRAPRTATVLRFSASRPTPHGRGEGLPRRSSGVCSTMQDHAV